MRMSYTRSTKKQAIIVIVSIFVVVASLILCMAVVVSTKCVVVATVTDKERVTESSGGTVNSKYLIFTEKETFSNKDSIIFFKFNSSDIYGKIKKDQIYKLTVCGWRVPFFSMYRNIIEVN